jgi:hypothetical protein
MPKRNVFRKTEPHKKCNGSYYNKARYVGRYGNKSQIDKLFLNIKVINDKVHHPIAAGIDGATG